MSTAWKQRLVRSLHINRSKPDARYFQLATVDRCGSPDNRTVVFRGFDDDESMSLLTVTDTRSDKVAQVLQNPSVSVAWYFRQSREQYRINGFAELRVADDHSLDDLADDNASYCVADTLKHWHALSDSARAQFFWPHPKEPVDDSPQRIPRENASPYFAVLLIHPQSVQYLDLKPKPQCRELYTLTDDGWMFEAVNP
ncbi:MAG: pyridoxamine 5'-phosphate oxidase family protein [Pseudomonadota bacterium]